MLVKALSKGFYKGTRIRAGAVFEVPDGTKGKWFEPVKDKPKPKKEPK